MNTINLSGKSFPYRLETTALLMLEEKTGIANALNIDVDEMKKLSMTHLIEFLEMVIVGISRDELVKLHYTDLIATFSAVYSGKKQTAEDLSTPSADPHIDTESLPPNGPTPSTAAPISPSILSTSGSGESMSPTNCGTSDGSPNS